MKKSILKIGMALSRAEQKQVNGGGGGCQRHNECPAAYRCTSQAVWLDSDDHFPTRWTVGKCIRVELD